MQKLNRSQLGSTQQEFSMMLNMLLAYLPLLSYRTGKHYLVRIGEVERSQAQADANAAAGTGIRNSLHTKRLAVDLHLTIDGHYQRTSAAHKPLGEFWESIGGAWGGRWGDGNHYSRPWRGIK